MKIIKKYYIKVCGFLYFCHCRPDVIFKLLLMIGAYNWNGKVVLVAEDEEINYLFLDEVLRRTGAKVIWAKNGREAVDICRKNKIDLILMDLKMPEMNGYEALQEIRETKGTTRIIAQTAFAMSGEKEEILEAGFDGYISKPIRIAELLKVLEANFNNDL